MGDLIFGFVLRIGCLCKMGIGVDGMWVLLVIIGMIFFLIIIFCCVVIFGI